MRTNTEAKRERLIAMFNDLLAAMAAIGEKRPEPVTAEKNVRKNGTRRQ